MVMREQVRHYGIVTQVFPPDPAAVGQHLADVADELTRRGHAVTVLTSERAYDDPSQCFPRFEELGRIRIMRLPHSSFGKGSIATRLASGTSLMAQAALRMLREERVTHLLLSTTPHLCGALGVAFNRLRGIPFHYWLMDLNPDQIVATGKLGPNSPAVLGFEWLNRRILRSAEGITALDSAMAARFAAKGHAGQPIAVQPPWAVQEEVALAAAGENPFRLEHGLADTRVVMHAGNHSAVHPLATLVEAIRRHHASQMRFFFVGGGVGKKPIEAWVQSERPPHVTLLPYQPRERVAAMLSAADVHVVAVGNETVGIVHPSKIYGALAAARPVIVLGPSASPAAKIVQDFDVGWHVEHGDVERASQILGEVESMSAGRLLELKNRAQQLAESRFSRRLGVKLFCDRLLCETTRQP